MRVISLGELKQTEFSIVKTAAFYQKPSYHSPDVTAGRKVNGFLLIKRGE